MSATYQTLSNIFTLVRNLSNKDSTTLTDVTLMPIANKYYYLMIRELIGLSEEFYAEISSAALVLNQREYVLPVDDTATTFGGGLIKILRVEASYNNTNWYVGTPTSLQNIRTPITLDVDVNRYNTQANFKYYYLDGSLFLEPVPDSDDYTTVGNTNLKIYWVKRPNELASASNIPDMPKDWLSVLQEGILYDVFRMFGRTAEAADAKQNYYGMVGRMRELEQTINENERLILRPYPKNYK